MLKCGGFSLFEMLLSLLLSSVMLVATLAVYPALYRMTQQYYQQFRLAQAVQFTLSGLVKDVRRAGFIANKQEVINQKALDINAAKNCILIRYDSEIRGNWIDVPSNPKESDLFAYRFVKNNLEYKTGTANCKGSNWEKMFDPSDIKITQFTIQYSKGITKISLQAELKMNSSVTYAYFKLIKNENVI